MYGSLDCNTWRFTCPPPQSGYRASAVTHRSSLMLLCASTLPPPRVLASWNFTTVLLSSEEVRAWNRIVRIRNFLSLFYFTQHSPGVPSLWASLGHPGGRRAVLGHTLNTLRHVITKTHKVLSRFPILCRATFTAVLGPGLTPGLWSL